ncbi:MAG: hypothetical protein PVJ80_13335 [Gemmatimonadota bacterium]|jgi:hypothetical protein
MNRNRLFALVLVAVAACGGENTPEAGSDAVAGPREVHFTASDFQFEGPSTIEAGMVTFDLSNTGPNLHHLQLVKLPDGMTLDAFQEALGQMQPGSPPPEWFVPAGGVNPPPVGGESAAVTMMIEPGEYAVLCLVDAPDHVPHVFKGMIQPLTVTPSTSAPAELPPADMTLTLVDYAFSFSTPPTAGSHVIHVSNGAAQGHEVAFIKLLPGKTVDDVMAWAETFQDRPFVTHGGVSVIAPGQVADAYVDFTPGEWMALCFVADATDGAPHVVHGMLQPFTIS